MSPRPNTDPLNHRRTVRVSIRQMRLSRSFNGGPGNCPAEHWEPLAEKYQLPQGDGFNGGPGNCPAEPGGPG